MRTSLKEEKGRERETQTDFIAQGEKKREIIIELQKILHITGNDAWVTSLYLCNRD